MKTTTNAVLHTPVHKQVAAPTLDQLRAAAYAAYAGHQRDLKTNPTYAKVARQELARSTR